MDPRPATKNAASAGVARTRTRRVRVAVRALAPLVGLLLMLCIPTLGHAAAPVLDAPAAGAGGFTEGASMTFEWRGALQGDADAINRSFFRLEIAKASDVPAGAQSEWSDLESFGQTDPGEATSSTAQGVPVGGSYKWRVCAWGVVDDIAANEIQQLPGGCSAARSFTSFAASVTKPAPGELAQTTTRFEQGAPTIVTEARPAQPKPAAPVEGPQEPIQDVISEEVAPAIFQQVTEISRGFGSTGSAVEGLSPKAVKTDAASDKQRGFASAIASGLGATLPLIPIPFWTLALLLACFPIARAWRRNVLEMFDWADGSINGSGAFDDMLGEIAPKQLDHKIKDRSITTDSEATAPPRSASDGRQTAA